MVRHCRLCNNTDHNASNCNVYPVEEIHNNILRLFITCVRYNNTNIGLNNYIPARDHYLTINNDLKLPELKVLAKRFGLNVNFNRAILCERLYNIYIRLANELLVQNSEYLEELRLHQELIEIQQRETIFIQNINNTINEFQRNINQLSGNESIRTELRDYISQMGIYLYFISSGINVPLPEPPQINKKRFNINITYIENTNNLIINNTNNSNNTSDNSDIIDTCPICLDNNIDTNLCVYTNCSHIFCGNCIYKYIKSCKVDTPPKCSLCRTDITDYYSNNTNIITSLNTII